LQLNVTTNPKHNPNLIPNPNLKTNPNSPPKSDNLNMVVIGF